MKRYIVVLFLMSCMLNSCSNTGETVSVDKILWNRLVQKSYVDLPEEFFNSLEYTVLESESQDYMFGDADKIVYRDGIYYILDWMNCKIVAYDKDGNPVLSLNKRGRAEGEYLRVEDFDIDESGNLWVIDAQKDELLEYSPVCEFIRSNSLPFDASYIKYISGDHLLFALDPWDTSRYKGRKLLITDTQVNIESVLGKYDEYVDMDYSFPTFAFADGDAGLQYHIPICDDVCRIGENGEFEKIYSFDFGSRVVPDKIRCDIESNRDKFDNYTTLVKSVYVDDNLIVGCVLEKEFTDFIVDRLKNVLYMQDGTHECLQFMGVTGGKIVYLISDDTEVPPDWLSEDILCAIEQGKTVLASIDFNDLSLLLK